MVEFLKELWAFMKTRKKFWLFPLIIILLFLAVIIIFAGGSVLAPFIYTIF